MGSSKLQSLRYNFLIGTSCRTTGLNLFAMGGWILRKNVRQRASCLACYPDVFCSILATFVLLTLFPLWL